MNLKRYEFSLSALEAELMWDFAQLHEVNFHFTKISGNVVQNTRRYTYEGFMTEETYIMFRLAIPARDVK